MKEKFENRSLTGSINITLEGRPNWVAQKEDVVEHIIEIVEDYSRKGYKLTLRQLYYQLVQKNYIPNHDKVYKKISSIKDDICYAGLMDWSALEDRGRVPKLPYWVTGIPNAIDDTIRQYRLDRQEGQKNFIEVHAEKDAISSILYRITARYHVRLVINKGYISSSAMYNSYNRIKDAIISGQQAVVLYLGDFDASGLDMIRDIRERILFFLTHGKDNFDESEAIDKWEENYNGENPCTLRDEFDDCVRKTGQQDEDEEVLNEAFEYYGKKRFYEANFRIEPIALTKEQVKKYNPPPNPAKTSDPRAKWYISKHGVSSWEVDALSPEIMEELVERKIRENIDIEIYEGVLAQEDEDKENLEGFKTESTSDKLYDSPEEWGKWICPDCGHENNDPEKVRNTVCAECETSVILSPVIDGKRKAVIN